MIWKRKIIRIVGTKFRSADVHESLAAYRTERNHLTFLQIDLSQNTDTGRSSILVFPSRVPIKYCRFDISWDHRTSCFLVSSVDFSRATIRHAVFTFSRRLLVEHYDSKPERTVFKFPTWYTDRVPISSPQEKKAPCYRAYASTFTAKIEMITAHRWAWWCGLETLTSMLEKTLFDVSHIYYIHVRLRSQILSDD